MIVYNDNSLYPWFKSLYNQIILSDFYNKSKFNILFSCFNDIGVYILVINIVKWLFCDKKKKNLVCNKCLNCNLVNQNKHPNFFFFRKCDFLRVNDVKEKINKMLDFYSISSFKVIYFNYISFKNIYINNFLLKIMEDSSYNLIFFFSYFNYIIVPNTLLSRCYRYDVKIPNINDLKIWLINNRLLINNKKNNNIELMSAIRINNYSPFDCLKYFNVNIKLRIKFLKNIVFFLKNKKSFYNFMMINNVNVILFFLYTLLIDMLYMKYYNNVYYNIDNVDIVRELYLCIEFKKIFMLLKNINNFFHVDSIYLNLNKNILINNIINKIMFILNK